MPYARNRLDGTRVYFEDDGGEGAPVLLYGGILDTVGLVRRSGIARALQELGGEFRLIYADHRGLGRSDKPHEPDAYAMALQVADAVAILDVLGIARAHVVGRSYGARLCFGLAEHAPERLRSLVAGGQQPCEMRPDGPILRVVVSVLDRTRQEGARAFVEALEDFSGIRFPEEERRGYLDQDGAALAAAAEALAGQGPISDDLTRWRVPCLLYLGAGDLDFVEQARRAAEEIPNAELVELDELDHLGAHFEVERVVPAVVRTLRENG
ncbi:MAG TPA: alpha/beta fold hydrolase [Gaiellaceae bacterium]|nr:alpha/beta fold hydrolase [Gaiellaceae bacterium]